MYEAKCKQCIYDYYTYYNYKYHVLMSVSIDYDVHVFKLYTFWYILSIIWCCLICYDSIYLLSIICETKTFHVSHLQCIYVCFVIVFPE